MPRLRFILLSLAVLVTGVPATAREGEPSGTSESVARRGRALGVGVALGAGRMAVGNSAGSAFVAGVVGRVGLDSRNRFQLIGEFHPMEVTSPILDESFRSANVLLGYSIGQEFTIRPVVGAQYRWWTGSERVTASDWGPVLGPSE